MRSNDVTKWKIMLSTEFINEFAICVGETRIAQCVESWHFRHNNHANSASPHTRAADLKAHAFVRPALCVLIAIITLLLVAELLTAAATLLRLHWRTLDSSE
jgi:hypothetical protein